MNIPKRCDVVIIGGGPGGTTAAALLSQKGYDVVLLEKAKHPRYMVGESLLPQFWKFCDATGVSKAIEAENFIVKAGGTVAWNGTIRQFSFKDFGYTRAALHVERDRFDQILLEHARASGAQIFEEVAASEVDLDDSSQALVSYRRNGEKAHESIAGRFVIDASGQTALLARQLGMREIDDGFRFASIWGYFDGSKYVAADGRAYPCEKLREIPPTTFVASLGDWGWSWHIPMRNTTSVGLIVPIERFKAIKQSPEDLEAYFLRQCAEEPNMGPLLEAAHFSPGSMHVLRNYSYRPAKLTGPTHFLIGDAAAFIDPVFSAGITVTMYAAYAAAWAIDNCLKQPAHTSHYQDIFASQYAGRYEVHRSLALPRYDMSADQEKRAKTIIGFESAIEQNLMYTASTLTDRSENLLEMQATVGVQKSAGHKYKVLDAITL